LADKVGALWLSEKHRNGNMQGKTLTVLLIEDSPDYAELVQTWLAPGAEIAFALNWTDSLAAGLNRLRQGGVDVILLDLGLPDSDGPETFTRTRAEAPDVPVIILSAGDSEALALQVIQEGAEDYLVKNTCNRELLVRAVRYALVRHKQAARSTTEASVDQAKVIGVIGAKGGVGTTTVACNLATELRRLTGKEVLLADLDVHAGSVSFLMSTDGKYSILDAIRIVDGLDHTSWEQLVTKADGGVHVLASPGLLGSGELPAAEIQRVLTRVRPMYGWIVLDLGRLNGISGNVLEVVNQAFVVTTIGLSALYEAKRVIGALVTAGVEGDRLRLIVNEIEETHSMSGRELNQIFGAQVYARLPRASEELYKACVLRKLPDEDSPIRREIAALARNVAGLPEKKSRRAIQPILSFAERFRRTSNGPAARPVD
jgi:Flp pilus assembly CpaE family ATPase